MVSGIWATVFLFRLICTFMVRISSIVFETGLLNLVFKWHLNTSTTGQVQYLDTQCIQITIQIVGTQVISKLDQI